MAVVSGESLLSGAVYYTSPPSETRQPHIHGRAQLPQLNLAKERSVQPWQDGSKGKTRPQDLSSIWLWVVGICGEDYRGLRFWRLTAHDSMNCRGVLVTTNVTDLLSMSRISFSAFFVVGTEKKTGSPPGSLQGFRRCTLSSSTVFYPFLVLLLREE